MINGDLKKGFIIVYIEMGGIILLDFFFIVFVFFYLKFYVIEEGVCVKYCIGKNVYIG